MLRLMCLLKGSVYCLNSHLDRANTMIDQSLITCPHCGTAKLEQMPTDACQFFLRLYRVRSATKAQARRQLRLLLLRPPYGSACLCDHRRDRRMERMILAASSG